MRVILKDHVNTMQQQAKKATDVFLKNKTDQKNTSLLTDIHMVMKDLTSLEHENMPIMKEAVFVKFYLPIFNGEAKMSQELIDTWVNIAGYYGKMKMVDQYDNYVMILPPIFDRTVIKSDQRERTMSVMGMAEQHGGETTNGLGDLANNKLEKALNNKFLGNAALSEEFKNSWKAVISHYNNLMGKSDVIVKQVDVGQSNPDADVTYEF